MANDESALLVLGVLPSHDSRIAKTARARRDAARASWLQNSAGVLTKFVLTKASQSDERTDDIVVLSTNRSRCVCIALVQAWFAHATSVWPTAKYFGKTEDDIFLRADALAWELRRLPAAAPLWYGLFLWSSAGCWGGQFEDDPTFSAKARAQLLRKEQKCPPAARPLAPSASHELDVRSAPLARSLARCAAPGEWLVRQPAGRRGRCGADCSTMQGAFVTSCVHEPTLLAHATWTKVHSLAPDRGWRPFAPASNLTLALDVNLADKRLRERDPTALWAEVDAATRSAERPATRFPPLLYAYAPDRAAGAPLAAPRNEAVAAWHKQACPWGGCHPPRDGVELRPWPGWRESAACGERGEAELCAVRGSLLTK